MANISPFASIAGSQHPLIPKPEKPDTPQTVVFAPIHAPQLPALPSSMTDVAPAFAPPSAPTVNSPASLPGQEAHYQDRLMADYTKDLHPWGSPESKHPGVFGKILHGLNVATGGTNRRLWEEQGLEHNIQGLDAEQRNENQEDAQTEEEQAQAHNLENPASQVLSTDEGDFAFNPRTLAVTPVKGENGEPLRAAASSKTPFKEYTSPDNQSRQWFAVGQQPEGWNAYEKPSANSAYMDWLADPTKYEGFQKAMEEIKTANKAESPWAKIMPIYAAQKLLDQGYRYTPQNLPTYAAMIKKMFVDVGEQMPPDLEAKLAKIPEGQPLSPETKNPIGLDMPEAPTASIRTSAQGAQTLEDMISDNILPALDAANKEGQVGIGTGRIQDFLLRRIGDPNSAAAKLQATLDAVGPMLGRMYGFHSAQYAHNYSQFLNTRMTPDALKGYLAGITEHAKTTQAQERGFGETGKHPGTAPMRYQMNGKEITVRDGKWVYEDTGKAVE